MNLAPKFRREACELISARSLAYVAADADKNKWEIHKTVDGH
jgi:hypothetical protein